MKTLLACLRTVGLVGGTLLVLGFTLVPFVFGAVAQVSRPRRLPFLATGLLGTAAFLVAWLGLDDLPLAFHRQGSHSLWPSVVLGWLVSTGSCQYAAFLVRALWPRRFAPRPLPVAGPEPLGLRDFRITVGALRFWVHAIKWSVLAFAVTAVLNFVSIGLLGIALYFPVAPVLWLWFAPQDQWHGDWVWPAVLGVGFMWSVGFLIAGVANHFLVGRRRRAALRRLVYVGILWLWALVVWTLTLTFAPNNS